MSFWQIWTARQVKWVAKFNWCLNTWNLGVGADYWKISFWYVLIFITLIFQGRFIELKHCTLEEIFTNMNETCVKWIFTNCDNENRPNFEETNLQTTYRSDTLQDMIHNTEHSRMHAEIEAKKKIMKYMTHILHGGHLQQSTTMVQQVILLE
jgi:hypothetical protein